MDLLVTGEITIYLGWWQLKYVLFVYPKLGEDSRFDYFSNGLKPPTTILEQVSRYLEVLKFDDIYTHRCDHPTRRFMLMF